MAFRLFRKWDAGVLATEAQKLENAEVSDQAPSPRHPLTWPVFKDHTIPIMKHPLVAIPLISLLLTPFPAFFIHFDHNGLTYRLSGEEAPIWMGFVLFLWLIIPGAVLMMIVPMELDKAFRQSGYTPDFGGCVAGLVYVVFFFFGKSPTTDYVLDLAKDGYVFGPLCAWSGLIGVMLAASWLDGYHLPDEVKPPAKPKSDEQEVTDDSKHCTEGK